MSEADPDNLFDDYEDPSVDHPEPTESENLSAMGISIQTESDEIEALATLIEAQGDEDFNRPGLYRDAVPTLDQEDPVATYDAALADMTDTFVISGPTDPIGAEVGFRGRMMSKGDARAWATEKYGRIVQTLHSPHRWAFRVPKPRAK